MGVGFAILPGFVTQASTATPPAPSANNTPVPPPGAAANATGGTSLAPIVAANGYQPTNYLLAFFGAAQTVTAPILWGYTSATDRWGRIGALPDIVIPASNQSGFTLTNAIGCFERIAISGTGTWGVEIIPVSVAGG
jgi:hypothetical protein